MILYYITDRKQFPGGPSEQRQSLLATVRHCAKAGIDLVQLREKDLSDHDLETLARDVRTTLTGTNAKLLINGRIGVAIAAGAQGVHLPSGPGQLPASEARVIFERAGTPRPWIAVSCHTPAEVAMAEAHGADLAVFGPVFGKADSPNPIGMATLAAVCARAAGPNARMPVLALGGMTKDNASRALAAGADGVAGIRLFQGATDIAALIRTLRRSSENAPAAPFRHPYQP